MNRYDRIREQHLERSRTLRAKVERGRLVLAEREANRALAKEERARAALARKQAKAAATKEARARVRLAEKEVKAALRKAALKPIRTWTPEENEALRNGRAAGESFEVIAHRLNRSSTVVADQANRLGIPRPERRAPGGDEIRRLWADGISASEIGRRMGLTKCTVIGRVRRMGLDGRESPIVRRDEDVPPPQGERDEKGVLKPGDFAWGLITAGTILEGASFHA